jgi:hypothetical protein
MDDERDRRDSSEPAEERLPTWSAEELRRMAADPQLSDDMAMALLSAGELPPEALEILAKNAATLKQRKVLTGIVTHPHAPRHVSLPALRKLFTFELMQVTLAPLVAPDLKRAAEDILIGKLDKIALGERLTLARRGSGRVAAALLHDADEKVVTNALENRFLTEGMLTAAAAGARNGEKVLDLASQHPKWRERPQVRRTLLRNRHLAQAQAVELARDLPAAELDEVLRDSRLPPEIQRKLRKKP